MNYLDDRFQHWLQKIIGNQSIPLFTTEKENDNKVSIREKNGKIVLCRHPLMESKLIEEVRKIKSDFEKGTKKYQGLLTFILKSKDRKLVPLFVTNTTKYGKDGTSLNKNLTDVEDNRVKHFFARWGDHDYMHIGELSNALFNNKIAPTPRKIRWKQYLFNNLGGDWFLKEEIFFTAKAWGQEDVDYNDLPISLAQLIQNIKIDFHPILMSGKSMGEAFDRNNEEFIVEKNNEENLERQHCCVLCGINSITERKNIIGFVCKSCEEKYDLLKIKKDIRTKKISIKSLTLLDLDAYLKQGQFNLYKYFIKNTSEFDSSPEKARSLQKTKQTVKFKSAPKIPQESK